MANKNYMLIGFLVFIFIVGIILVVTTVSAQQNLPNTCVKSDVNIAMNIVVMLGVMFIILPFTQLICSGVCECDGENNVRYKTLFISISIILAICGGIIWQGVKDCSAPDVESYGLAMMIIGIIIPILIGVYNYRDNIIERIQKRNEKDIGNTSEISVDNSSGSSIQMSEL